MKGSPFVKPFEKEMNDWESKLMTMQHITDNWLKVCSLASMRRPSSSSSLSSSSLITLEESVGVSSMFGSVCLFVCLSVCLSVCPSVCLSFVSLPVFVFSH